MLGQRIITALVLIGILLPALFASQPWPFQLLTLVLIAAAAWEWGRLNSAGTTLAYVFGAALAAACAIVVTTRWSAPPVVWWMVSALWVFGGAAALRAGPAAWTRLPLGLRWALGLAGLWVAWLAIAQGRAIGINFLLSVFALVWAADIAAYFAGRAFGRRKLAPTISPGKSWEGVAGGVVGVGLLAWAWTLADARFAFDSDSLYTRLQTSLGDGGMIAALALLAGLSVAGDLVESLVKRACGAKDSSRLLPGHGGVLDRVDALLPVCPAALALLSL